MANPYLIGPQSLGDTHTRTPVEKKRKVQKHAHFIK